MARHLTLCAVIDHDNLEEFGDPLAYDDENTLDEEGAFFLAVARRYGGPVLDVACGTGRMTIPLAQAGFRCVGVDIVEPMLARARDKSAGLPVEYVCADARSFALPETFGLAVLTGHAFQGFVTDDDQRAVVTAIHRHLRPGGGFAFETRSPAAPRDWDRSYRAHDGRWIDVRCTTEWDEATQILHVRQQRTVRGTADERVSRIALRYRDDAQCTRLLESSGFRVAARYGDWYRGPMRADATEMIYVCERA